MEESQRKVRKRRVKGSKGKLFVVSAPSGAGKTTLCKRLGSTLSGIKHSVSYTTRKPRPGEVNDEDYTFVDEERFRRMIKSGEFVEWAEVHGNLYGTSKKRLQEMLESGTDVILDIDTKGARQMRKTFRDGFYIFVLPPSMDTLRERLQKRMSESGNEMEGRLKRARDEIRDYAMYDYVIVNDIFEKALKELQAIVVSERGTAAPGDTGDGEGEQARIKKGRMTLDPSWVEKNFLLKEED